MIIEKRDPPPEVETYIQTRGKALYVFTVIPGTGVNVEFREGTRKISMGVSVEEARMMWRINTRNGYTRF